VEESFISIDPAYQKSCFPNLLIFSSSLTLQPQTLPASNLKMTSKIDQKIAKPLPAWCQFSAGAIAGVSELLLLYPLGE